MKSKKIIITALVSMVFLTSCEQAKESLHQEVTNHFNQANEKVKQTINDLGLVYVEEGAKDVITYEEVNAAQQAWCDALVKIGKLKDEGVDYKAFADQLLSEAYNYDHGKVFFKPTLAHGAQTFRNDKKGALAYFVGGDLDYPNDKGFALKPWVKARYDNAGEGNEGIQIMARLPFLWATFG